jgi:NitT/TauT family transport system substrate-binding protein
VDITKIKQLNLDFSAFVPALLQKRIDGFVGFAPTHIPVVSSASGEPANALYYADAGIVTLSMGIVAHPDTVRDRPQAVRALVRGVQRGMQWTLANSAAAAELMVSLFPRTIKPETAKQAVDISNTFLMSARTEKKPLGFIDEADAQDTLDILRKYGGVTNIRAPGSYFTNVFIDSSI